MKETTKIKISQVSHSLVWCIKTLDKIEGLSAIAIRDELKKTLEFLNDQLAEEKS
jgi:hypothetical protein